MNDSYKKSESFLGEKVEHPSFATLAFSRTFQSPAPLFGSSIKHGNVIRMTLYHASQTRGLNKDWIHGQSIIAEAEMSYSQFVEAITNMNVGFGVPCTLRYLQGEGQIPRPDFEDKTALFKEELQTSIQNEQEKITALTQEMSDILAKKSIGKADRERIRNIFISLVNLQNNIIPFMASQFHEEMNATIQSAKGEIEAFMQNKMHSLLQENIQAQLAASDEHLHIELPESSTKGDK